MLALPLLAIGGAGLLLNDDPPTRVEILLRSVLFSPPFGFGTWIFIHALRRYLLVFDPATGVLRGPSLTRNIAVYPRPGWDRIEYDSASRRLLEIGPDGRRLIMIPHWAAHSGDWATLTDQLPAALTRPN